MRKKIFTIAFIFCSSSLLTAQDIGDKYYNLTFEDTSMYHHLMFNTLVNKKNIWQIGKPNKQHLKSSLSSPNVIITDTINPYPVNDTSVFQIINTVDNLGWAWHQDVQFSGYYQSNSDTLTDYGKIEISPDNGETWIDLIKDSIYSSYYDWITPKPVLSGNSNGWIFFKVSLSNLSHSFNIQMNDTIRFRFTFISDNVQTNKDGIMYDNFMFSDLIEGLPNPKNDNLFSIYPNPCNEEFYIIKEKDNTMQSIQIFDFNGKTIHLNQNYKGEAIITKFMPNGIYIVKYSNTKSYNLKKLIVQH